MMTNIVKIHAIATSTALLLIISFFSASLISEVIGNQDLIVTVKNIIFYGIWVLIPSMAITGISGAKLAGKVKKGLIGKKMKRMPVVAANGLLILTPAAVYLRTLAMAGDFGAVFYVIQVIELLAGAINIALMSMNFRDGLKISKTKIKNSAKKS